MWSFCCICIQTRKALARKRVLPSLPFSLLADTVVMDTCHCDPYAQLGLGVGETRREERLEGFLGLGGQVTLRGASHPSTTSSVSSPPRILPSFHFRQRKVQLTTRAQPADRLQLFGCESSAMLRAPAGKSRGCMEDAETPGYAALSRHLPPSRTAELLAEMPETTSYAAPLVAGGSSA